jgi:hypothetical protein
MEVGGNADGSSACASEHDPTITCAAIISDVVNINFANSNVVNSATPETGTATRRKNEWPLIIMRLTRLLFSFCAACRFVVAERTEPMD